MDNTFENRQAPSKITIWLSALGVVVLLLVVVLTEADHLKWMVWTSGAVTLAWMLMPRPIYGIKVDHEYLVLSAWRKPKYVRLSDIAHLRATNVSEETNFAIVYTNGEEEGIFAADLPEVDILIAVMAERGIPVRDVY